MRTFQSCVVVAVTMTSLGLGGSPVLADAVKCERTIARESARYRSAVLRIVGICKAAVITKSGGVPSAACPTSVDQAKIDTAFAKMQAKIAQSCGGPDGTCGTPDDPALASIRWDIGHCMGLDGQCRSIAVTSCATIGECLRCLGDVEVEQSLDVLLYDRFEDAQFAPANQDEPARSRNHCQVAIANSAAKFVTAKDKLLNKCWDAKLRGKAGYADGAPCPDTDPRVGSGQPPAALGDNKTVEGIKRAEQKKVAAICAACGGGGDADLDGVCDLPGFALDDIVETVPFSCPNVRVPSDAVHPGGVDCSAITVSDLQTYVACVDCVLEHEVDCAAAAPVGDDDPDAGIEYPSECSPVPGCPAPVTRYEFTANGSDGDADIGWTGYVHDQPLPTNGRLTLAIDDCIGGPSSCGECTLTGPIVNTGAAFANRRCRGDVSNGDNGSWIYCTNDADCPGLENACVFYFGPPQPVDGGGFPLCLTSQTKGPITGTVNVDSGEASFAGPWMFTVSRGTIVDHPCPRCVAGMCDGGERDGQPCTANGSSARYGDVLSLDCPPEAQLRIGLSAAIVPFATGTQTRTLSSASPQCTAFGHQSRRCFCDTCDDAAAEPCFADADCPAGGTCGGLRCLVGSAAATGTPCTVEGQNTDPVCGQVGSGACNGTSCVAGPHQGQACEFDDECGGICGVPGIPTAPSSCTHDGLCNPNPSDTDSINEGQCSQAPDESHCSIQPFHHCVVDADCNPPSCPSCTSGQTCVFERLECFTGNGVIGGSISAGGVASTTAPTFGGLFCLGPSGSSLTNSIFGLPGPARLTLPGTVVIH